MSTPMQINVGKFHTAMGGRCGSWGQIEDLWKRQRWGWLWGMCDVSVRESQSSTEWCYISFSHRAMWLLFSRAGVKLRIRSLCSSCDCEFMIRHLFSCLLLLGYRRKWALRGDEPHILSGSVRRHHLLRSDGRGKFRESPLLGERTQKQWGGTKIDVGFTLIQDIFILHFAAVFKSYPVCMLILSQSHVRWGKNVPVTWSDEKLILLYCPGVGIELTTSCSP